MVATKALVVTLSGRQSAGSFSSLMEVLSVGRISDLHQDVVDEVITLTAVLEADADMSVVKDILFGANAHGFQVHFQIVEKEELRSGDLAAHDTEDFVVTLLVRPQADESGTHKNLTPLMAETTSVLASHGANIASVTRLSEMGDPLTCFEFGVRLPNGREQNLRRDLLDTGRNRGDISLQKANLQRRSKRLFVFDLSWTVVQADVMDLVCATADVEVPAELRASREQKKLNGTDYLRKRAALLVGCSSSEVASKLNQTMPYTDGAADLCRALKKMGYKVGLISSGAQLVAEVVKKELDLSFAYGNILEIDDEGCFTGEIREPVVDAARKAELLQMLCMKEGISVEQIVAVGDGPVSSEMLSTAGLSVSFEQPDATGETVGARIANRNLTTILYFLGLGSRDIKKVLGE